MSWTAPRTWVDDEVVTASLLNTHLRDNQLVIDQHAHTGSSGEGSQTLGNLVKATFTDAAAPAAPASGLTSLYAVSGKPHYRPNGGADTELSEVGHGHTFTEDKESTAFAVHANDGGMGAAEAFDVLPTSGTKSATATLTSISEANMIAGFGAFAYSSGGATDPDHKHELIIDGVSVTSATSPPRVAGYPTSLNGSRATSSGTRTVVHKLTNSDSLDWRVSRQSVAEAIAVII